MGLPIDDNTMSGLTEDANRYSQRGAVFFVLAVIIGIALLAVAHFITVLYVHDLNDAEKPELMLVLLLVRGAFFGALAIAFLYGLLTVATAYIDQATRFRKRLYSAHMINYAFITFNEEIKTGTVTLREVVGVFSAWNENVDSAFSNLRFQKKSKDLKFGGRQFRLAVEEPSKPAEVGSSSRSR